MAGKQAASKGSLGYADRLSAYKNKGVLGLPETVDTKRALANKATQLADLIRKSRHTIVHTGAGISTGSGIPDFRGPKGVWTLEKKKKKASLESDVDFELALPSLTHMALVGLIQAGKLQFIVSQNVDGLHIRSGVPEELLAELHGNMFCEVCKECGKSYYRPYDVNGIGCKPTGRFCTQAGCDKQELVDTTLDWEDELPQAGLAFSEEHSNRAQLAITLGTSLQIIPASELPLVTGAKADGNLVIINLQATKKDEHASLKINGRCDEIMREVMRQLKIQIPPYVRTESIIIRCLRVDSIPSADGKAGAGPGWGIEVVSGGATDDHHLNYIRQVTFDVGGENNVEEDQPSKKMKVEGSTPVHDGGATPEYTIVRDADQPLRWCKPSAVASPPVQLEVTICFQPALRHGPCTIKKDLASVVWDLPNSALKSGEVVMSWEHQIEVAREDF